MGGDNDKVYGVIGSVIGNHFGGPAAFQHLELQVHSLVLDPGGQVVQVVFGRCLVYLLPCAIIAVFSIPPTAMIISSFIFTAVKEPEVVGK